MRCQRVDEADGHIIDVVFELASDVTLPEFRPHWMPSRPTLTQQACLPRHKNR